VGWYFRWERRPKYANGLLDSYDEEQGLPKRSVRYFQELDEVLDTSKSSLFFR
jgi:hypothetical protein